ncbi:hypothetical protein ACHAW5_009954, partial [Stephanodiscus triporus]
RKKSGVAISPPHSFFVRRDGGTTVRGGGAGAGARRRIPPRPREAAQGRPPPLAGGIHEALHRHAQMFQLRMGVQSREGGFLPHRGHDQARRVLRGFAQQLALSDLPIEQGRLQGGRGDHTGIRGESGVRIRNELDDHRPEELAHLGGHRWLLPPVHRRVRPILRIGHGAAKAS